MNTIKISDSMPYLICEKCGGYYELGDGESLADFESCQCGGTLKHVSVWGTENLRFSSDLKYANKADNVARADEVDNTAQKIKENDKPKLTCSNCLKENEDGIFCSECGGKLITVKGGKAISDVRDFKESKQIERLSKRASRNVKSDYYDSRESKDLFDRINWLGVVIGVGSFLILFIILTLITAFSIMSSYSNFNYSGFLTTLVIYIILVSILITCSGGLAAFLSKSRDYTDGLINGFLVGLISSTIVGIFSGISTILIGILIYGVFATLGGAIGIFVRKRWIDKN